MADDLITITVKIAEKPFKPKVKRSDEQLYREAADCVNGKLLRVMKTHPKQDMQVYLSLVSLELAIELLADKKNSSELMEELEKIEANLSESIK
ncbi:MAG: cell division protein ZapA [Paludibacteraceae bacterium]